MTYPTRIADTGTYRGLPKELTIAFQSRLNKSMPRPYCTPGGVRPFGLGIDSFGLDCKTVVSSLWSLLHVCGSAILSVIIGYLVSLYFIIIIMYWNNFYDVKKFTAVSRNTWFDRWDAQCFKYIETHNFWKNNDSYKKYSRVHLNLTFAN